MNRRTWLLTSLFIFVVTVGCGPTIEGSGRIVTDRRDISDASRLSVCCGFDLRLSQGESSSLELKGDDNLVDAIDIERRGEMLYVEYEDRNANYRPTQAILVRAVLTEIEEVVGSGGSEVRASRLESDRLKITLSGGSDAEFEEVVSDRFDLAASGGSEVDVRGEVDRQIVQISGGGEYRAKGLASRVARIRVSGGGRARVRVEDTLDVVASGGSEVIYYGAPSVNAETSGGSRIVRR